ncbi:hypothetical protein, partial [Stenotrophomonas sp. 3diitr2024]|uniref:hypothetical protein n=1 Tax=Stenotrophomonas sp. 3diitr2024 TaxID=3345115 RepID=UPI0035CB9A33
FQYFAAPPSFGELDAGAAFDVLKANLAALGTGGCVRIRGLLLSRTAPCSDLPSPPCSVRSA